MCPEKQLLSVYVDSELPSPWKEKLQAHLQECQECSQWIALQMSIKNSLSERNETMEAVKARVWKNVSRDINAIPQAADRQTAVKNWMRSMNVPLPVALAAALVLAMAAAWLGGPLLNAPEGDAAVAQLETGIQGVIPVSSMSGILQYLENQDTAAEIVIIRLPESRNFTSYGEPAIIRAADYSRRTSP